jgi:hypothetical protein
MNLYPVVFRDIGQNLSGEIRERNLDLFAAARRLDPDDPVGSFVIRRLRRPVMLGRKSREIVDGHITKVLVEADRGGRRREVVVEPGFSPFRSWWQLNNPYPGPSTLEEAF